MYAINRTARFTHLLNTLTCLLIQTQIIGMSHTSPLASSLVASEELIVAFSRNMQLRHSVRPIMHDFYPPEVKVPAQVGWLHMVRHKTSQYRIT
jgi:hypothetical protein